MRLISIVLAVLSASIATATMAESMVAYGNDTYFSSDGSGITGSLELAAKIDQRYFGLGFLVATPEVLEKKRPNNDPLPSMSRMNILLGKGIKLSVASEVNFTGRVGLEGGAVDDVGFAAQNLFHSIIGQGSRNLISTKDIRGLVGVSSWVRVLWASLGIGSRSVKIVPYGHTSLGNDTVEIGGGLMVAIQPLGESALPLLLLPKNGSYTPVFGGEGLGVFVGARRVAYESLFDDLHKPVVAEIGIVWQKDIYRSIKISGGVSCSSTPYDGAVGTDCKADMRLRYSWLTSQ